MRSVEPGTIATSSVRPIENGDTIQRSKSSGGGKNFQRVDEADPHNGDSTYVYASTNGYVDLYRLGDVSATMIDSVTVQAVARVAPGTCAATGCLRLAIKRNGPHVPERRFHPVLLVRGRELQWMTNPATGQPWTPRGGERPPGGDPGTR